MSSSKLFKLTLKSYIKRMRKVNFYKKIAFLRHADNYVNSHFQKLRSYCDSVKELKPNNRRRGRW